jgi:hypothetical protein
MAAETRAACSPSADRDAEPLHRDLRRWRRRLCPRLNDGIELFSIVEAQTGRDDHRESISTGVRLWF